MSEEDPLRVIREKIDKVDLQIMSFVSERAKLAKDVAAIKKRLGDKNFYRPERESQVLRKIMDLNDGTINNEDMAGLFRQIMSICLSLEQPVKVAYLGPEGTFTQEAALKHFAAMQQRCLSRPSMKFFERCCLAPVSMVLFL